jgi:hypothetical protein
MGFFGEMVRHLRDVLRVLRGEVICADCVRPGDGARPGTFGDHRSGCLPEQIVCAVCREPYSSVFREHICSQTAIDAILRESRVR